MKHTAPGNFRLEFVAPLKRDGPGGICKQNASLKFSLKNLGQSVFSRFGLAIVFTFNMWVALQVRLAREVDP